MTAPLPLRLRDNGTGRARLRSGAARFRFGFAEYRERSRVICGAVSRQSDGARVTSARSRMSLPRSPARPRAKLAVIVADWRQLAAISADHRGGAPVARAGGRRSSSEVSCAFAEVARNRSRYPRGIVRKWFETAPDLDEAAAKRRTTGQRRMRFARRYSRTRCSFGSSAFPSAVARRLRRSSISSAVSVTTVAPSSRFSTATSTRSSIQS